jgi:3-hydroxyacyl-CoA dehydrogenase
VGATVSLEKQGNVGVIVIDNPPVNALARGVRRGLHDALALAKSDPAVEAVVLHCAGRTFIAGADISEFGAGAFLDPDLNDVIAAIEAMGKPVVAALHGTALGGGFEVALGCHYRVALPAAMVGLPEVTLGLLPGAGGTQRLPRLVGVASALEAIVSGAPMPATTAHAKGAVDAIVEGELLPAAVAFARGLVANRAPLRMVSERLIDPGSAPPSLFAEARASVGKRAPGAFAPARIVDCVEAAVQRSFLEGLAFEREQFLACLRSPQARALLHLFFAEREAAKIPGLPNDVSPRSVEKIGIVGAGTMGGGIAMAFANAGIPVRLLDASADALAHGIEIIRRNYETSAAKGRIGGPDVARRMGLISGTLTQADLADCDLVIEAVFENMEVKRDVCAMLGEVCKRGAIIATNTSTLDVDALAAATGRRSDVLGMHFFSPANVMRLLEVVRGAATGPDVLATVMALAKRIHKVAVVSGVCYGFIGNRMLDPYMREAEFLLLEGATPQQVDGALEAFGMAMGPFRMMDMAGVDVGAKVVLERRKDGKLPADPAYRAVGLRLFEAARYGQKTGRGFYAYEGRQPLPDPEVDSLLVGLAKSLGIARRGGIGNDEIVERCLYPLINEGAKILDEGIAYRAGDIDVVWIAGYGFPTLRGGPLHYAGEVGLERIYERLVAYCTLRGNGHGYWQPSPLLARLAGSRRTFDDFDHGRRALSSTSSSPP